MKKIARAFAVLVTALTISSIAGIRGPGKYAGVVVFDRWDSCYIYSGVYLMYVSQKVSEPLRKYLGLRSGTSNHRNDGCSWSIEGKPLAASFSLKPRQRSSITISLVLPRGEYDFLCGYGGGVHEDKALASNAIAFDVDKNNSAMIVSRSNR